MAHITLCKSSYEICQEKCVWWVASNRCLYNLPVEVCVKLSSCTWRVKSQTVSTMIWLGVMVLVVPPASRMALQGGPS